MTERPYHSSLFETEGENHYSTMISQCLCGVLVLLAVSYGVYGQGLSEEEKEEILNAHNHYRGQVDPVATNMLKMVSWRERERECVMITLLCRSGMRIWPI